MAIEKAIYVPLFTEQSTGVESPFFYVAPGEVVQAMAFDFVQTKSRDASEREVPLVACLERYYLVKLYACRLLTVDMALLPLAS